MRIFLLMCSFAAVFATPVFACTCVSPPPEVTTARDLAHWHADRSDVIFEGTVKRVELSWVFRDAKVGDLVPADLDQDEPRLKVTFDVARFYKGVGQKDVSLTTGIGGGDCGFDFETGERYLVYAFADSSGELSTGICSGTGFLEDSQAALSYLRGQQVVSEAAKQNSGISPTRLCGHVASTGVDVAESQLFLFRIGNESPIPTEEAEVAHDGSFCFVGAQPGSYYLAFMSRNDDSPTSFVLFPGTTKTSDASRVELKGGQTHSDLTFIVQPEATVSVSGAVLVHDKSALPAGCKVLLVKSALLRLDADLFFLGIQPNCLNVHSYSASGLAQVKGFSSSRHARQRINSSLLFHFAVVTAPIVFLKHNKPDSCPLDEWQHMVLSETRGLWLCSIVGFGDSRA